MLRHALACTGLLALCGLLWLRPSLRTHAPLHREYSIDHGYVISLNPRLDLHTPLYLGFESTLVPAINSSVAVQQGVPLYVRHTMAHGRHDHLQISNGAMLGCYLSHVRVWEMFLNTSQEVVAVFEEDAALDESSSLVLSELWHDMRAHNWSIVMLEKGHFNVQGAWTHLGTHLATCADVCTWFGTKAYVINRQGAQHLLRYSRPVLVQVDALISLVAEWDPDFHMYWTRTNVVGQRLVPSTVWDGCLKCYMPVAIWPYVVVGAAVAFFPVWRWKT